MIGRGLIHPAAGPEMFDFNEVFGSVTCPGGYQNNLGLSGGEVYNLKAHIQNC